MSEETGNGRVTLAVLATKLDYVIAQVDKIDKRTEEDGERIDRLEETVRILKWAGGILTVITISIVISAVKRWLGF